MYLFPNKADTSDTQNTDRTEWAPHDTIAARLCTSVANKLARQQLVNLS